MCSRGHALPQCDLEALQEHISTVEGVLHSLQDSIQGESQSRVSFTLMQRDPEGDI